MVGTYVCMYACMHACMYVCIRRWWHRGKVPGRRSVAGRHDTVTVTGKHHGYDANCAGFSKDVKQPHSSETHRGRENSHKCRFARHLHALLPTLGQSSGSRGHRLLDSLSGRETRACPPSKKLTGRVPAAVAKTQRLHACYLVTTWQLQYLGTVWTPRTNLFYIA